MARTIGYLDDNTVSIPKNLSSMIFRDRTS